MRTMATWLSLYGESHQHPTNIALHKICVPAIFMTVLGFLCSIPTPSSWQSLPWLNWATLVSAGIWLFYLRLSWSLALGVLGLIVLSLALLQAVASAGVSVFWFSLAVFALAWVGQFIGHHIEGKRPSFFQDVVFLLIGPAWTLAALYRVLKIPY